MTRIAIGGRGPTGLRWANYVNGRLLTATDLTTDQDAVLRRDRWLGLAVGSGVAEGLQVTGSSGSAEMRVSPGTGLCPGGIALHLDAPATLDLVVVPAGATVDGALFAECSQTSSTALAPVAGAYVLVVRPASSYDGAVPVAGSPTAVLPTPCASRWQVEDLEFAVIRLDGFTAPTTAANRRNLLATWCFGGTLVDDLAMSGFTEPVPFRGLDGVDEITPCDVALAVFGWDGGALEFVDQWSARRRPVRPSAAVELAAVVDDGRTADGEARFLQFQDQLAAFHANPAGPTAKATEVFPMLPPAGVVPFDPLRTAALVKAMIPAPPPGSTAGPAGGPGSGGGVVIGGTEIGDIGVRRAVIKDWATGATTGPTKLGALSQELVGLQQELQVLRAQVAKLPGAPVKGGGGGITAVEGRRLLDALAVALADTAGAGLDLAQFFAGVPVRLGIIDRESVDFVIRRSWIDEPIDLAAGYVVNVFFVSSRGDDGDEDESFAPYVLFTRRQRRVRWLDPTGSTRWK